MVSKLFLWQILGPSVRRSCSITCDPSDVDVIRMQKGWLSAECGEENVLLSGLNTMQSLICMFFLQYVLFESCPSHGLLAIAPSVDGVIEVPRYFSFLFIFHVKIMRLYWSGKKQLNFTWQRWQFRYFFLYFLVV